MTAHIPVLKKEVLEYLAPKANENFIDCTIGFGGHAKAILKRIKPKGRVLGIERDPEIFKKLNFLKIERLVLVNGSYSDLKRIAKGCNFRPVSGILFDLGVSSWHFEESGRGFTFQKEEFLDMRYGTDEVTAGKIVNEYSESDIVKILKEYGQERFAKKIAKRIIKERKIKPIKTTFELRRLIPRKTKPQRTFQALRIAVNDELGNLRSALPQALEILKSGGRIVVISFHSLEDRIVKNFFKNSNVNILTKKPIRPSKEEIEDNPRSSSAKLRAAEKK